MNTIVLTFDMGYYRLENEWVFDYHSLLENIDLMKVNSGINIAKSKYVYQVVYDTVEQIPLSVSFIGIDGGVFSFDIITDTMHSNKGYAKTLVLNCISKFKYEKKETPLRMIIDVVNYKMRKLLLSLGFDIVYKHLYANENSSVLMEYKDSDLSQNPTNDDYNDSDSSQNMVVFK